MDPDSDASFSDAGEDDFFSMYEEEPQDEHPPSPAEDAYKPISDDELLALDLDFGEPASKKAKLELERFDNPKPDWVALFGRPAFALKPDETLRIMVGHVEIVYGPPRATPEQGGDDSSYGGSGFRRRPMNVPIVRIYGTTAASCSVLLTIYGFFPVFRLLVVNASAADPAVLDRLRDYCQIQLAKNSDFRKTEIVAIVNSRFVWGFPGTPYVGKTQLFAEFALSNPRHLAVLNDHFHDNPRPEALGGLRVAPYSTDCPLTQFLVGKGVKGCGWIEVLDYTPAPASFVSTCSVNVDCNIGNVRSLPEIVEIGPLRVMAFDIECLKGDGLPDPIHNPVIVVCAILMTAAMGVADPKDGTPIIFAWSETGTAASVESCGGPKVAHTYNFNNELDMMCALGDFVAAYDPDYLVGHNSNGFDIPYLVTRANAIGATSASDLGRRRVVPEGGQWRPPREIVKTRKNGDTRKTLRAETVGRVQLDTMIRVQEVSNESSYGLSALSAKYLDGAVKDDVGYNMINHYWRHSDEKRGILHKYCLWDVQLSAGLMAHKSFQMVLALVCLSRETVVPATKVFGAGKQVMVKTLIHRAAASPRFDEANTPVFFPYERPRDKYDDEDNYKGATVLYPVRGVIEDRPTCCADFYSLYPSIIYSLNLCYTTHLVVPNPHAPDVPAHHKTPTGALFVDRTVRQGILPRIVKELLEARDQAKAMAKKAADPASKLMYDNMQLGLKCINNSIYGLSGAQRAWLYRRILAATITAQGRTMIENTRLTAMAPPFNAKVVYGDSVTGDTPIVLLVSGSTIPRRPLLLVVPISDMIPTLRKLGLVPVAEGRDFTRSPLKTCWNLQHLDVRVWSDKGFVQVRRHISHDCNKRIYRVRTAVGIVDCTEDHSLVRGDTGEAIKPGQLFAALDKNEQVPLLHTALSAMAGEIPSDMALRLDDAQKAGMIWRNFGLGPAVPPCVLNAPVPVAAGFVAAAGIDFARLYQLKLTKLQAATLDVLATKLGMARSSYTIAEMCVRERPALISQAAEAPVYDLETDNHHFHVAPGGLVVHNTDSVLVTFPDAATVDEAWPKLKALCKAVSDKLEWPCKLQAEKLIQPLAMIDKKKYSGVFYYEGMPPKIESKGLESNRRDNCPLVRRSLKALYAILYSGRPTARAEAQQYIHGLIADLIGGKIEPEDLVITKSISKAHYAGKVVQLEVAQRNQARDPSFTFGPGERIPFMFVCNNVPMRQGSKSSRASDPKTHERAEDPLWAITHDMQPDMTYYIEKQLARPISRIMMYYVGDMNLLQQINTLGARLSAAGASGSMGDAQTATVEKRIHKLIDLMLEGTVAKLFGPGALASIPRPRPRLTGPIARFIDRSALVKREPSSPEDIARKQARLAECRAKCTACRGYEDLEVQCRQKDCVNLFRLAKAAKDVEDLVLPPSTDQQQ